MPFPTASTCRSSSGPDNRSSAAAKTQGPAAAALANAIADATGKRFRDLPLSRQRIKAAIGV
jgi:CO/xanthine dehydrogenase Mo-binding subunit